MIDIDLDNIPKLYIPREQKELYLKPGARVCWGASIFQEEHQGRKAVAMIGLLASLVEELGIEPHVLINDTGNRYNYQFENQSDEKSAHMQTYDFGQRWTDDHSPYFDYFGIHGKPNAQNIEDLLFLRWEYFLQNPRKAMRDEIQRTQDAHRCLAVLDRTLSNLYDNDAEAYMSRPGRPILSKAMFEEGKLSSRNFLVEESGTLATAGRRYDALLYWKKSLSCHEYVAAGDYKIPDDLTWKQIPDSVAAYAADGLEPFEALIDAARGFERMPWIQVKRDPKKRLRMNKDCMKTILDRAQDIAHGGFRTYLSIFREAPEVPSEWFETLKSIPEPTRPDGKLEPKAPKPISTLRR